MVNKQYIPLSNTDLADQYFRVAKTGHSGDIDVYQTISCRIAGLNENIVDFYYHHGESLRGLQARGIGEKTKCVLERILVNGEEAAVVMIVKEKIDKARERKERYDKAVSLNPYDARSNNWREQKGQLCNRIRQSQRTR